MTEPAAAPSGTLPPATPPSRPWMAPLALGLAGATVVGLLFMSVHTYNQMRTMETQLARRIGEFDAASREARSAAKAAGEALADLQNRLMALETQAQETQNQQVALGAMYQELAHSADERVVADIEQTLLLAQQQLQLAGNIKAALIGLEAADARLGKLNKPQFNTLRQAIVQDMARLKLMPGADIEAVNVRLEALIQAADTLKTEADAAPPPPQDGTADAGQAGAWRALGTLGQDAWKTLKDLLRIRRLDHPELPLLTPSQRYFLEENLKLRLLSARLALLQRDETGFRNDLKVARAWVERYFTRHDPATQAYLTSLGALLQAPVALQETQLKASLKAVQQARGRDE